MFATIFATTFATDSDIDVVFKGLSNRILPRIATSSVKAGDIVQVQSGNGGDTYWTPQADMVVLRVREDFFGKPVIDGICMREDGTMSLKMNCAQYVPGELFKCTTALFDHQMKRYLSANDYADYTRLMAVYAEEIEHLERYTEIHTTDYLKIQCQRALAAIDNDKDQTMNGL